MKCMPDKVERIKSDDLANEFEELEGRRPRIFLAKLGDEEVETGLKVWATTFADTGWTVDVGPLSQGPVDAAQAAIDNDVDMVGLFCSSEKNLEDLPEVMNFLDEMGRPDIMVCVGGIIPREDYEPIFKQGVTAIFGGEKGMRECCHALLEIMVQRAKEALEEE